MADNSSNSVISADITNSSSPKMREVSGGFISIVMTGLFLLPNLSNQATVLLSHHKMVYWSSNLPFLRWTSFIGLLLDIVAVTATAFSAMMIYEAYRMNTTVIPKFYLMLTAFLTLEWLMEWILSELSFAIFLPLTVVQTIMAGHSIRLVFGHWRFITFQFLFVQLADFSVE